MLIEIHYGEDSVLLVNGNCRAIHLLDYIRKHCNLPSSIPIDLCLLSNGEPFHLSSFNLKFLSFDRDDFPRYFKCILTKIDDQGKYIPLSNNSKLITNELLSKLSKATSSVYTGQILLRSNRQSATNSPKPQKTKRRRSLKSFAIAAAFVSRNPH